MQIAYTTAKYFQNDDWMAKNCQTVTQHKSFTSNNCPKE